MTITTYYPSPYGSYQQLYVADKLGIGTTTPLAKLHVQAASSDIAIMTYGYDFATTGTTFDFGQWTGGAFNPWMIINNGDVGIGVSGPAEKLEVAGNIKLSGVSNPHIDFNGNASIVLSSADKLSFQGITNTNVCVKVAFPSPGACPANYWISSYLAAASGEMVCCMVD